MSRIKRGPVWVDEGPSRARVAGYVAKSSAGGLILTGGEIVTGSAGPAELQRVRERAKKATYRARKAAA